MKFRFRARIYKVGINPCVEVPFRITRRMQPFRGYIPIRGKIENHNFRQTLVPVKNSRHRLYVNGLMLKGAGVRVGQGVNFSIEQDSSPREEEYRMPTQLKDGLRQHNLLPVFARLTPSRQKEILRYLNFLKTQEALARNIDKVVHSLLRKVPGTT